MYNFRRPKMLNNHWEGNTAAYGNNIASYPVRIVQKGNPSDVIYINDVGSRVRYENILELQLVDFDNQVMVLDDSSQVKIIGLERTAIVSGTDYAISHAGTIILNDLIFDYIVGATNVQYRLISSVLDSEKLMFLNKSAYTTVSVSFRF